jgi:5,6-dimethylbenzimidazole synthase
MNELAPPEEEFRVRLRDLLIRRDVRRFRPDPLPVGTLEQLFEIACLAPSVGLRQLWRFILGDGPRRRQGVRDEFKACNADAFASYSGDTAVSYAILKLAGL